MVAVLLPFFSSRNFGIAAARCIFAVHFRGMAENANKEYFFVQCCPRIEVCSPNHWKKSRVWDWTEEECRARLKEHLMTSGKHLMDEEEAELTSQEPLLETAVWPDTPAQVPPSKKQKYELAIGAPKGGRPLALTTSSSSSSSGFVQIKKEHLSQVFGHRSDFAH
jgi:hypothetical protein